MKNEDKNFVTKNQVHDNITSDLSRSFVYDIKKWILKTC